MGGTHFTAGAQNKAGERLERCKCWMTWRQVMQGMSVIYHRNAKMRRFYGAHLMVNKWFLDHRIFLYRKEIYYERGAKKKESK